MPNTFTPPTLDFPLLQAHPELSFLDSAASAQKPHMVLQAENIFQQTDYANIHRGLYQLSQKSTQVYENARETVRKFINAPAVEGILFTRNSTESINLAAQTWARAQLKRGDAILLTRLEHHANIVPWQMLAAEKGLKILVAEPNLEGTLGLENIQHAWQSNVKLLAITHRSNALGTVPDLANIIPFAKENGAKVLVDGSQSTVHSKVDMQALGADFFCFTGHKLYGPTGMGVLYAAPSVLPDMPPYQGGGDMIERVTLPTGTTYAPAPARFEAGTPNIVGAVGLMAAIQYLQQFDMAAIQAHECALAQQAREGLKNLGGIDLYGTEEDNPIVSFTWANTHPQDVATILDQCNVACRTGHHCAMPLMDWLNLPNGTIRASFALYNTEKDVLRLVDAVTRAQKLLA